MQRPIYLPVNLQLSDLRWSIYGVRLIYFCFFQSIILIDLFKVHYIYKMKNAEIYLLFPIFTDPPFVINNG